MSRPNQFLRNCKLRAPVECKHCVVIVSRMLNDLYIMAQKSQWRTYQLNRYPEYETLTYTNNFNVVIDLLMRMVYLFNVQLKRLKKEFKISNILMLDDSTLLFKDVSKDKMKRYYEKHIIQDLHSFEPFTIRKLYIRLIGTFVDWSRYTLVSEEEDNDEIERKLSALHPELYNTSYRNHSVFDKDSFGYRKNKRSAKNDFIENICQLQCRVSSYEIKLLFEFFMLNLKANKVKELTILPVRSDFDEMVVFNMFSDSRTLFVSNKFVSCADKLFMFCGEVYYPFTYFKNKFQPIDVRNEDLIRYITGQRNDLNFIVSDGYNIVDPTSGSKFANGCLDYCLITVDENETKQSQSKVNTFQKLLKACEAECEIGVFDANCDYRYQFFENVKSVIADECFDLLLPEFIEDKDFSWVSINDYIEQLPAWIGAFNKFNYVKLVLRIQ